MNARTVTLTIDGHTVTVPAGTTLYDAASSIGIRIPVLCHQPNLDPVAVCRVCAVQVADAKGTPERVFAAACIRQCEDGKVVDASSPAVTAPRRMLVELLLADHGAPCVRQREHGDCELEALAAALGLAAPRFAPRPPRPRDDSSVTIAVDHSACILCDRCIRACTDVKSNFVIGRQGKGSATLISFDANAPMGESSCVACGECMVSCPTGALTNQRAAGVDLAIARGTPLAPDDVRAVPVFAKTGVSSAFLEKNSGAIVRRQLAPGEIVCREGEFGSTAFYIEQGTARVFLGTPLKHLQRRPENGRGLFARIKNALVSETEDPRGDSAWRTIPIDAPVDLPRGNPVAQLGPGDLFGEMSCLNFYPRSATVEAESACTLLEMNRNVLNILMKNREFKRQIDATYRQRALDSHLRSIPVLAGLTSDFLDELRERVELVRYEPGQTIIRQGDPADAFYLIRVGFVKVTQRMPGGELTLTYLSRGGFFGEIALLSADGVRIATCTALDHVELVRIAAADFRRLIDQFPAVRTQLAAEAERRVEENRQRAQVAGAASLDSFLRQGLMEATSLLVIDLEKCTRCDDCVRACSAAHDGVTRLVRDGLRFDKWLVATSCRQCADPLCMVGCPVGSIRRREGSREIVIEDWCIGCGLCAQQCPYGNISMHPITHLEVPDPDQPGARKAVVQLKATSCDLDSHHTAGGTREPACVVACPHDAARRVEPRALFERR